MADAPLTAQQPPLKDFYPRWHSARDFKPETSVIAITDAEAWAQSYGDACYEAGQEATPSPPVAAPPATPAPDLLQRCQELLAWHKTGKLEGDALRQFAAGLFCPNYLRLRLAETQTADEAFSFVVAAQPQPQPAQPLTDSQIKAAVHGAVKSGRLSWMGYEKDEAGEYTVPVLSPSHYQLARAIEAILTAPSTPTPPEVAP